MILRLYPARDSKPVRAFRVLAVSSISFSREKKKNLADSLMQLGQTNNPNSLLPSFCFIFVSCYI